MALLDKSVSSGQAMLQNRGLEKAWGGGGKCIAGNEKGIFRGESGRRGEISSNVSGGGDFARGRFTDFR